jgi:hypothetical protein
MDGRSLDDFEKMKDLKMPKEMTEDFLWYNTVCEYNLKKVDSEEENTVEDCFCYDFDLDCGGENEENKYCTANGCTYSDSTKGDEPKLDCREECIAENIFLNNEQISEKYYDLRRHNHGDYFDCDSENHCSDYPKCADNGNVLIECIDKGVLKEDSESCHCNCFKYVDCDERDEVCVNGECVPP